MGFWDSFKKREERGKTQLTSGAFSLTTYGQQGASISEDKAMEVPAVASAIELISSSIAQLPVYLYAVNDDNEQVVVPNDRRVMLLNKQANNNINGYNLKKSIVRDYTFHGGAYLKPKWERNDVVSLHYLPINQVSITKYIKGYEHTGTVKFMNHGGETEIEFDSDELVRVLRDSEDGLSGSGVLARNGKIIRLAAEELNYTESLLKNNAMPASIVTLPNKITENVLKNLKNSWQQMYGGTNNTGKTAFLEEGADIKTTAFSPDKLQLTESRRETLSEICRIFNIPETMLNSKANKYASNEQDGLYFLQYCISPIISAIEGALDNTLLLESEKENGYFFKFDSSEILRTTEKEKIESIVTAVNAGLISVNEGRKKLDYNNLDHDYFFFKLGSVYYDREDGSMFVPNTNASFDAEGNKLGEDDPIKKLNANEDGNND